MATTLSLDSIEQFHTFLLDKGFSSNTARAYAADARCFFAEWVGGPVVLVQDLENQVARWLIAGRPAWAPRTMTRKMTSLKKLMIWTGIPEPLQGFRGPKAPQQEPHPLPEGLADIQKMLAACTELDHCVLIALCGLTGLRISEALAVQPKDFDYRQRLLTIRGKGDVTRVIPVSDAAWDIIGPRFVAMWLSNETGTLLSYCDRSARKIITTIGHRAGLARDISSHDLRATFATEAYANTKDIHAVARLLGHASVTTTMLYVKSHMDAMRRAANFV